jgi:hypothetical protein
VRLRARQQTKQGRAELLGAIVKLCDEDVTLLGEQLRRLGAESPDDSLDGAARVDYQKALDGYESAQRLVGKVAAPEDIVPVTAALNDSRYALACVHARIAGEPVPERRAPCFFNPQHGPSVEDVMFTPRNGGTQQVAACAQDAARVKAGEEPEMRRLDMGGGRIVKYHDALSASVVLDAKYHEAAIKAGVYGGFLPPMGGGGV